MGTFSIIAFVVGLLLEWYENKIIVLDVAHRPDVVATPLRQTILFLVRLLTTYGSLAGIFFVYGPISALVAFAVYWLFSAKTFRRRFDGEVLRVAKELMSADERLAKDPTWNMDDSERLTEADALKTARRIVEGNIKTGGRGDYEVEVDLDDE